MASILYALDQNFPQPIVNALTRFQAHAELRRPPSLSSAVPRQNGREAAGCRVLRSDGDRRLAPRAGSLQRVAQVLFLLV